MTLGSVSTADFTSRTQASPIALVDGGGGSTRQSAGRRLSGMFSTSAASNWRRKATYLKGTGGFRCTRDAILDRPLEARSARQLFPIGAVTESHSASQDEQVSQEPLPRDNRATGNEEFNTAGFNELSFDATLVKEAFARVETHASQALEYFYAHLFVQHPELRAMFPLTMSEHRQRVFAALARLVWSVDSPAALNAYAGQLGRDHRKFGVKERHYSAFFDALLTTVQYFSGTAWTAQTQAAFSAALDYTAAVMLRAAALDAEREPPWWVGEGVRHQLRGPSLAVLTIQIGRASWRGRV